MWNLFCLWILLSIEYFKFHPWDLLNILDFYWKDRIGWKGQETILLVVCLNCGQWPHPSWRATLLELQSMADWPLNRSGYFIWATVNGCLGTINGAPWHCHVWTMIFYYFIFDLLCCNEEISIMTNCLFNRILLEKYVNLLTMLF